MVWTHPTVQLLQQSTWRRFNFVKRFKLGANWSSGKEELQIISAWCRQVQIGRLKKMIRNLVQIGSYWCGADWSADKEELH
jgi:hypothetical protein